jgi:hypothetical protein
MEVSGLWENRGILAVVACNGEMGCASDRGLVTACDQQVGVGLYTPPRRWAWVGR